MITVETSYTRSGAGSSFTVYTADPAWVTHVEDTYEQPGKKTVPETEFYYADGSKISNQSPECPRPIPNLANCVKMVRKSTFLDQAAFDSFRADAYNISQQTLEDQYYAGLGFIMSEVVT
jgi:hypothetical protein